MLRIKLRLQDPRTALTSTNIQNIELSRLMNRDYGGDSDGLKRTRIRGATLNVGFRTILVLHTQLIIS